MRKPSIKFVYAEQYEHQLHDQVIIQDSQGRMVMINIQDAVSMADLIKLNTKADTVYTTVTGLKDRVFEV